MILCEEYEYTENGLNPVHGTEGVYLNMDEITLYDDKIRSESGGKRFLRSPREGVNEKIDSMRAQILRLSDEECPKEHKEWYRLPPISIFYMVANDE